LAVQFKEWRERDWFVLGYPPQRPSAWWFALATDAVWMMLLLFEQALVLMKDHNQLLGWILYAMQNPAQPKPAPLPVLPLETPPEGGG
jgi:hypothetical protein